MNYVYAEEMDDEHPGPELPVAALSSEAPADLGERVESDPATEERPGTELFGLPMMLFIFALIALVKGLITGSAGFTIIGAIVAGGIFLMLCFNQPLTHFFHWVWDLIRYIFRPII